MYILGLKKKINMIKLFSLESKKNTLKDSHKAAKS